MSDVNVQYVYIHGVQCLINFIPIDLNFTARGSLILKGLSETNVLIHSLLASELSDFTMQNKGQLQGCHNFLIFSMKQIISLLSRSTAQMPPS